MRDPKSSITVASLLLAGVLVATISSFSADQRGTALRTTAKKAPSAVSRPDTTLIGKPTQAVPRTTPMAVTAANPNTGEQIKWQVISAGGTASSSTSFKLSATVGQTAAGPETSTNYKLNQGFWQNFTTSCCIGKRGNVNTTGIIDSADLAALVSYLTGGGYTLLCYDAANVNGTGIVDSADLAALVSYLTGGGYALPNCP